MKLPRISIITPSYNQARFIRATIDSVLTQDYPNLEYFVIDGGSDDGTIEILKSYGEKLNWVSEKDHGQTDAINKGLKKSTGEVLAFLNSDDILFPGALNIVGEYFANHKDCDWLTGNCNVIGVDGRTLLRHNWLVAGYKKILLALYSPFTLRVVDNMFPQPSTFWTRRAYEKIGQFDESYHYVMDYDYWLRLSKYFKPHYLRVVLSGFRSQPNSKSETSRSQMVQEGVLALKKNGATKLEIWLHALHSQIMVVIYKIITKS